MASLINTRPCGMTMKSTAMGGRRSLANKTSSLASIIRTAPAAKPAKNAWRYSGEAEERGKALHGSVLIPHATHGESKASAITGIVFQPFVEVEPQVRQLDEMLTLNPADVSYARTGWVDRTELAINEQINVELNIFYVYQSMYAYFDRDNVGLPGFAAYFRRQSDEELAHARTLINYQNNRGGRVRLGTLLPPQIDYHHDAKGDALFATELALSLEKLNFRKLWALVNVANEVNDVQLADFVETYLLEDQMKDIKHQANLVSQLRRVGLGHGVFHVDLELQREYGGETANLTRNLDGNGVDGVGGNRGDGAGEGKARFG